MQRLRFNALMPKPGLYHANVTRVSPGEVTAAHTHDFTEFFQVLEGTGTHHWNGEAVRLQRGDLVFICPRDRHWYSTGRGESLVFINIAMAAQWWAGLARLLGLAGGYEHFEKRVQPFHVRLPTGERENVERMLVGLFRGTDEHGFVRTCLRVVEAFSVPERAEKGEVPEWLAEIRREMGKDVGRAEVLSRGMGYWQERSGRSKEHFSRSCRKHYGVSPTELLNRFRIEHVQVRLRTSTEKLAVLALEAGFGNLGYFYRVFRQEVGSSPDRWRRRQMDRAVPR